VPRDENEFKSVFKVSELSAAEMKQLELIRREDDPAVQRKRTSLDEALKSESDLILIVAHNDQGALVDTSGERRDLDALSKECARLLKLCVFLACNAKEFISDLAVPAAVRDLGAREALRIAKSIGELASKAKAYIVSERDLFPEPHPAFVIEEYLKLVKAIVAEVEATDSQRTALLKVILVRLASGLLAGVIVGLVVCSGESSRCERAKL